MNRRAVCHVSTASAETNDRKGQNALYKQEDRAADRQHEAEELIDLDSLRRRLSRQHRGGERSNQKPTGDNDQTSNDDP